MLEVRELTVHYERPRLGPGLRRWDPRNFRAPFASGSSAPWGSWRFCCPFHPQRVHNTASNPGRVYSRKQLLDLVWGHQHDGYEYTVNSHINRLRGKIEHDPAKPDYVLTVWGVGYKFSERPNRALV